MRDNQYEALRIFDLVMAIAVYIQSRKLEKMLDDKEQFFLDKGYQQGRLSSPFIKMRRLQLKVISTSYLITNLLILVEMVFLVMFLSDQFDACTKFCAQPYDDRAAVILLGLNIFHLLPVQLNVVSFYFIPRKFHVEIYGMHDGVAEIKLNDLDTPLLVSNFQGDFNKIDDDINWQVRRSHQKDHERRGSMMSSGSSQGGQTPRYLPPN